MRLSNMPPVHSDWAWFSNDKWMSDKIHRLESIDLLLLLTYFHLVIMMSSGFMAPLLHGISSVSPYRPITVSTPPTVKDKSRGTFFNYSVRGTHLVSFDAAWYFSG